MRGRDRKCAVWLAACVVALATPAWGFEVSGQVLDEGVPIAGAEVSLHVRPSRERAARSIALTPAVATVKPSSDGEFLLPIPTADPNTDYLLVASAPGRVPVDLPVQNDESSILRAPLGLPVDAGCRVRVVDERGQPVAKAAWVVEFVQPLWFANYGMTVGTPRPDEGETDATGAASFPCPAGQDFELSVFAAGHAPVHVEGSQPTRTITLRRPPEQTVRFVDSIGKVIANVGVYCCRDAREQDGRLEVAKANAGGIATLRADASLALTALAPDGSFASFQLESAPRSATASRPPTPLKPRVIVLARPHDFSGRVVEARTGRPIAGARVEQWAPHGATAFAKSAADGSFRLVSRVDPADIGASAGSYLRAMPRKAHTGTPVTLELTPARRIGGVVVDEAGKPLSDVEWTWAQKRFGWGGAVRTRGDKEGHFALTGIDPELEYAARAVKRGYGGAEFDVPALEKLGTEAWRVTLPRGGGFTGVVVDSSGRPIPGARVTWKHTPPQTGGVYLRPRPAAAGDFAIADGKGAFRAGGIQAGPYQVALQASGFGPLGLPNVELESGQTTELGRLVLERGLEIRGRVVDAADQPLAGVAVEVDGQRPRSGTPTTDAAGAFSIADLAKANRIKLSFSLTGYARRDLEGIEAKPDAEPMRVVLLRSLTVSGRVVDEQKRPVAGARVTVGEADGPEWQPREMQPGATTDFEGCFVIQDVKPGGSFLIASAEGFQETRLSGLELSAGQNLEGIEAVLTRGGSIAVRVLDEGGKPAAEALVVVIPQTDGIRTRSGGLSTTDREGRVVIRGVSVGPHSVQASHRGRNASTSLDVRPGENAAEVRFRPAHSVRGVIVDPEGVPVAEAQIWLRTLTGESDNVSRATTDAAGAFEIPSVTDGAYAPYVTHTAFLRHVGKEPIVVAGGPVEGVRLVLERGGQIRGRILGLDRSEFASLQISVRGVTPSSVRGVVQADGSYTVSAAPLGAAEVQGWAGEKSAKAPVEVVMGTVAEVDLQFNDGVTLLGSVRKAGEPVSGFWVEARGLGFSSYASATTDVDGLFRIEGLTAGRHRVAVANRQYKEAAVREVEVGERGAEVEIDLTGAFVGGQVVDAADKTPIVGAEVSLISTVDLDEQGREWEAQADSRGIFVFHDVPDGDYRLNAIHEGYAGAPLSLTLEPGERKEGLTIELESADALTVHLSSPLGQPASVSYVVFDGTGAKVTDGWRDVEEGRLRVASLGAGSFTLLLSSNGFATVDLPVSVPSAPLQVALEREATVQVSAPGAAGERDITARLVRADGRVFRRRSYAGSGADATFGLTQGRARIGGLPSGSWTVFIERDGAPLGRAQVQVTPGSEVPVVVDVATP